MNTKFARNCPEDGGLARWIVPETAEVPLWQSRVRYNWGMATTLTKLVSCWGWLAVRIATLEQERMPTWE